MEQSNLFRKKSLESIQSPEQLNDYLCVTNPSVWLLLTAVILLLAGLLVWGSFTYISSVAKGVGQVENGVMTLRFEEDAEAGAVEAGMSISVGESEYEIRSVGRDGQGLFALADTDLADGSYEAGVCYRQTQILRLLFR